MICLKNRTFVVSTTTSAPASRPKKLLWFAWKIVPLWYQQQLIKVATLVVTGCDLLEKSYLCGINNNGLGRNVKANRVVICLKNRTFVVSTTTLIWAGKGTCCCDLLEKSYLCGINNNLMMKNLKIRLVVICLKNRTFVVSTTTQPPSPSNILSLWFAWKIVPLWYQQQPKSTPYLWTLVVICLKNRTFVVSTTTRVSFQSPSPLLWFAWKIVPLWYQQQR